jgi:hypothetical protein
MQANEILSLDVSKYIEKKNGLTYLSWASAWEQALRIDPNVQFHVESWSDDNGEMRCWMNVNGTALVWVRVTFLGSTRTCMLPVMDNRSKPVSDPDAFQINTAIMRCLTKCLGLFGLGLYIYRGEDLPKDADGKKEDKKEDKEEGKNEQKKEEKKESDFLAEEFAQMMVDNVIIVKTMDGLRSYWKKNLDSLKRLESERPDLYEHVKSVIADKKAELEKTND